MNIDELIYSLKNLLHRRLRSFLSALSILIGIAAIFALVSFGLGLQAYTSTLADEAGANKLFIQAKGVGTPGTDSNFFLTSEDVDFISKIKGVDEIVGMYFSVAEIEFKDDKAYAFAAGFDVNKQTFVEEAFTVGIEVGRDLKKGETNKDRRPSLPT